MFSIRVFVDLYVAILLTCIGFGRGVHLNARNRCVWWLRYVIFLWPMVCLDDGLHFFSTFFPRQSHLFQHLTPLFHHQRSFVRVSFYICINLQWCKSNTPRACSDVLQMRGLVLKSSMTFVSKSQSQCLVNLVYLSRYIWYLYLPPLKEHRLTISMTSTSALIRSW